MAGGGVEGSKTFGLWLRCLLIGTFLVNQLQGVSEGRE